MFVLWQIAEMYSCSTKTQNPKALLNSERAVVDLAIESWRFQKLFGRALAKLDAGESSDSLINIGILSKR